MEQMETMPEAQAAPAQQGIQREKPTPDPARLARVEKEQKWVLAAKKHWEDDFKRMRENMQMAYAGAPESWVDSDQYVVPIITRHINQAVASLYAKNPQVVAEKRKRLNNVLWDGKEDTVKAALETIAIVSSPPQPQIDPATGAMMPPPQPPMDPAQAMAIIQEVQQIQANDQMLEKVCRTSEVLLHYYFNEQEPNFKQQLKQMVRRTKICAVGYVFLGYQRLLEKRPEISAQIADASEQIARLQSLTAEYQDGLMPEDSAKLDELKSMMADLEAQEEIIVREGPVFDFPRSTEIIIDPKCKQLSTLVGAGKIVREFHMDADEVQDVYKVDIKSAGFRAYEKSKSGVMREAITDKFFDEMGSTLACVWEVWNKHTGQVYTLIDGYCDFVKEPAAPDIRLERFWPLFVMTLNDIEHETKLMPLSDVHMLRHPQMEYNRSRQYRRLHREANKPAYATVKGRLSEEDKNKLATHPPHAIIEFNALAQGETIESLLQVIKHAPIDPALYETNSEMEDVFRTVGSQEANMGGTSGATATEASIGEQSRATALDSNVDDLDELLSAVTKATHEMLLLALDAQTAKRIAGPGAEWPQLSRQEIVEQVMVQIKAGSSGRPNKAADLANMERGLPYMLQMNGINVKPLGNKYAKLLDIDVDELVVDGLPSQVALNAMASKAGNPGEDPMMQGGAANAPAAAGNEPGPQPAYPVAQYDQTGARVSA